MLRITLIFKDLMFITKIGSSRFVEVADINMQLNGALEDLLHSYLCLLCLTCPTSFFHCKYLIKNGHFGNLLQDRNLINFCCVLFISI